MSTYIKKGDVPSYLIPDILISNSSAGKIIDCVKELCCDEYLDYLKMIPKMYIIANDNTLLKECAKNNSIEATKYVWEITKKEITIAHLNNQLAVAILATKQNQIEFKYIDWILSNEKIESKTINNNSEILYDCINEDNLKLFLKIYSHFDFENMCMINSFTHALINNKLLFVEVIYEILIQRNIFDSQHLYKQLHKYKFSCDILKWLYDILGTEINSDDFKKIYTKTFNDLDLLKFIESKCEIDENTIDLLFDKYVSPILGSSPYTKDEDKAFESFTYIYFKRKRNNQEIQGYFDNVYKKYKQGHCKYLMKIAQFLIDEGAEVLDFKNRFHDYFNNRNQIRLKKLRLNYIGKKSNDNKTNTTNSICI